MTHLWRNSLGRSTSSSKRRSPRRTGVILAGSLLGLIPLLMAPVVPAEAQVQTPAALLGSSPANYVALGDSFSAGYDNPGPKLTQQGTDETGSDDGCSRTSTAYPVLLNQWLAKNKAQPSMSFEFFACTGATTTDLWSGSPALADGLTGDANHMNYSEGPQLEEGGIADAKIITLSIGGDDISFPTVVGACVVAPTDCNQYSSVGSVADLYSNINSLESVLISSYNEIKNEAPNASIYVTGYPDLVPPNPSAQQLKVGCGDFRSGSAIEYLSGAENNLNNVVQQAATSAGVTFVDPNPPNGTSFASHTVCSKKSWFNTMFHPNVAGQADLAKVFESKIAANSMAPSIIGFSATPSSLASQGGTVDVSANVDNGVNCTLSSKPKVFGLPSTVPCWAGSVSDEVTFPPNASKKTLSYRVSLKVTGKGAANASTTVTVNAESVGGESYLTGVKSVESAGGSYCALLSTGGVDCWGDNSYGEIGNGKIGGSRHAAGYDSPQPVTGITDAISVRHDASYLSSCALLATGGIDCWGNNTYGQLGNGTVGGPDGPYGWTGYDTPQAVVGISNAISITPLAGVPGVDSYGYCALLSTGGVECWGTNASGQLGNGSFTGPDGIGGYDTPQVVVGITDATALTGNCAVLSTGGVDCWGDNSDGQLGNGTIGGTDGEKGYDTPQPVVGIDTATSITGFEDGYCAILSDGGVACWGDNSYGQLGNGTIGGPDVCGSTPENSCYDIPQPTVGVADVTSIEGGLNGYCALTASGAVDCWGDNSYGQLGNGATGGPVPCESGLGCYATPQSVVGLTAATSVTANLDGYCALLSTGGIDCWGQNAQGELGNGTVGGTDGGLGYDTPQAVTGVTDAISVTSSGGGNCALLVTSSVDCWGLNNEGQLGMGKFGGPDGTAGYDTPQVVAAPGSK